MAFRVVVRFCEYREYLIEDAETYEDAEQMAEDMARDETLDCGEYTVVEVREE